MEPEKTISPLNSLCLGITGILDAALGAGIIDAEEYNQINSAAWQVSLRRTPRVIEPKPEAADAAS